MLLAETLVPNMIVLKVRLGGDHTVREELKVGTSVRDTWPFYLSSENMRGDL